jgi:phenylalanyl-tRNA synthetase beta chain
VFDYSDNVEIISANNINRQFLRNNTIDSLLRIYKYNSQYKNKLVPLFETQKIYQENKPGIKNLTIITPEIINLDNVNKSNIVYNVNGLKAIINQITKTLNATVEYKIANNKHFYDNECISINYKGNVIGYIGCIKKTLLNEYNVNEKIYCASIN